MCILFVNSGKITEVRKSSDSCVLCVCVRFVELSFGPHFFNCSIRQFFLPPHKFGARDPKCHLFLNRYVYCNILDSLFDITTTKAATPFQVDRQNAANTQESLRARQAVENREEEGCVYSIQLSDLIGKLLELKYIRSTRSQFISTTVPVAVE